MHGHLVHMDGGQPLGEGPRTKHDKDLGTASSACLSQLLLWKCPCEGPAFLWAPKCLTPEGAASDEGAHTLVAWGPVPTSTQFPMMALSTTAGRYPFSEVHSPIPLASCLSPVLQETLSRAALPGKGWSGRRGLWGTREGEVGRERKQVAKGPTGVLGATWSRGEIQWDGSEEERKEYRNFLGYLAIVLKC